MVVIGRDVLDSKSKLEVMVMLCKTVVFIAANLLIFNEKLTGLSLLYNIKLMISGVAISL